MVPLWIKLAFTLLVSVIVVVYVRRYPLSNFLWFSNVGLIGTTFALWLESSLLASMMALGLLVPSLLWYTAFFSSLAKGRPTTGGIEYMFDERLPLYLRALSLYHLPLPFLSVWLVAQLGYAPMAVPLQLLLAWIVYAVTWLVRPQANVNYIYGWQKTAGADSRTYRHFGLLIAIATFGVVLPTHVVLSALFA